MRIYAGLERREETRHAVRLRARFETREESGRGRVMDISNRGLRLRTDERVEARESLRVELRLPGSREPIRARAVVRWAAAVASFDAGLRFTRIEQGRRRSLEAFLRREEERAAGRTARYRTGRAV